MEIGIISIETLSPPLGLNIADMPSEEGNLSLQYHCINTNQMVRTRNIYQQPLSVSPRPLIPQPNPRLRLRLRLLHLANILSQIFHISVSRLHTVQVCDHGSISSPVQTQHDKILFMAAVCWLVFLDK